MNSKSYVWVRSRYYKRSAAKAVLDHADARRTGFTSSNNVHWEHSVHNAGYYFHGAESCSEALELMCEKHKTLTGKKVRVDNNVLFEHVLCLSEKQYSKLEGLHGTEKVKQAVMILIKRYCQAIKSEFGFEYLGYDIHYDEGRYEKEGSKGDRFIRNIHCHIQFMNFDFSKKIAPLRYLMTKGTNNLGKTNQLNPHFERIQNIAFLIFKDLGFNRSVSKSITNRKHLKKEAFVKQKVAQLHKQTLELKNMNNKLLDEFKVKKQMFENVSLEINSLKAQLNSLHDQIDCLGSLKAEMLEALEQGSELALRQLITKKLVPSIEQVTETNLNLSVNRIL